MQPDSYGTKRRASGRDHRWGCLKIDPYLDNPGHLICFTSALARDGSTQKEEVEPIIHRIDATVLFVGDLARCTTFYRDTLGLQVKNSDPNSVAFLLDVDAAYEALVAKGVTVLRPPTNQPWGLRTAHFADPEGNLWEINQSIEAKPEG